MAGTYRIKHKFWNNVVPYTFILPSFLGLVCFSMFPLVIALFVSLTDWNFTDGIGIWTVIGLKNFLDLWADEWFRAALLNTIIYTAVTVPVSLFLSLVIAVVIDKFCRRRLAAIARISMYMPHICNIVATSAVWIALLSSYGPFTQLMRYLGWADPPRWLADYFWALPAVMLVSIWSSLGYRIFIYSASLQGVSRDLYDAADIDGANTVQQFFRITIPMLKPTTFFLTITGIIASFKAFGTINVMTRGGPGHSTYTLVYYIYTSAFQYYRMGYSSSIAVVLFIILLGITLYQWHHNKQTEI
ncbi:MAG: sugar ABC transporter permease [Treponema sp.]|nr:sugar ABC transporter permease [Treponema sp.]